MRFSSKKAWPARSWLMGALVAIAAAALAGPAAAQRNPNAMTCDYYKKQIGEEITRQRRAEQAARREEESARITQGMDQNPDQPYQDPYARDQNANQPPRRDYSAIDQLRREGEMYCARRNYVLGVASFKKALNLLGVRTQD